MGVCGLHWPADVPMIRVRGRYHVPSVPPSIFKNVPLSCIPTPNKPRTTSRSTTHSRAQDIDEMSQFKLLDSFNSETFIQNFKDRLSQSGLVACSDDCRKFVLLSNDREGPVPTFSIYFHMLLTDEEKVKGLQFDAYRQLKVTVHPLFPKGIITSWSQLDEVLRFVTAELEEPTDKKHDFLLHQLCLLNAPKNSRLYCINALCRAFSWCSKSRALYNELRDYIQLPSLSTLRKITRVAKNTEDDALFKKVFQGQEERNRGCVIIIDEIYVKASLSYRGGVLFGYAEDDPEKFASTLLCIMVKCCFGGKKFLAKLIPCHALTAAFQFDCVMKIISSLESSGARVLAVINDNNRVNQAFFKMFSPHEPSSPWCVKSFSDPSRPMFLLYDPVQLIKNIINNWLTEKTKTIRFPSGDNHEFAKWTDLEELHQHESTTLVKLSKLNKASVNPSNIEKQKVNLALNVFCSETSCALKTSSISTQSWKSTATFIEMVLKLWKVLNCKTPVEDIRLRDPDRTVIDNSTKGSKGTQVLIEWAHLASQLKPNGGARMHSFTKDTAEALAWTCKCLVDLCRHLLNTTSPDRHDFVCLGFFQQDDLERHFGHFRSSAGCNFYITTQEVFNTHSVDRAKLLLSLEHEIDYKNSSHQCNLCDMDMSDVDLCFIDDMTETDTISITPDEKMSLFYIAGYVASKHPELSRQASDVSGDEEAYLSSLNRGGLSYPTENFFKLVVFAYMFFINTKEKLCRNRLIKTLSNFPGLLHLDVTVSKAVLNRVANIFMKRFSMRESGDNKGNQERRKVAKLTSKSA